MDKETDDKRHIKLRAEISERIKYFYSKKEKARVYHGSTNSTRPFDFNFDKVIDVSALNAILEINVQEGFALVEPNVSMEVLVYACLSYQVIPPIIMEFPAITVGGGVQGGAGESSSFKYGLFHNICSEYEIILGNGEIVIASHNNNSDLFYGIPGSYGTLGIITAIKIKVIPVKKFVELNYIPTSGFEETLTLINKYKETQLAYIDGILFSKDAGMVMAGDLSNYKALPVQTFHRASDEWFYLHAQRLLRKKVKKIELIPLTKYLFRYDRGAFWMGYYAFRFLKIPFNRVTRYAFYVFSSTKALYRSLHASSISQEYIIQDFCVPQENALEFLQFLHTEVNIYPLWLCPIAADTQAKLSPNYINASSAINIGVYGKPKNSIDIVQANKNLEAKALQLGARKWLYAHVYQDTNEFWSAYDFNWYAKIRSKYHAEIVFPSLYEKIHTKVGVRKAMIKGLFNLILSPFRLRR